MYKLICRSFNKSDKSLTKFTDIYKKVSRNQHPYRHASKACDGEDKDKPGRLTKRRSGTSFAGRARITFKTLLFPKRSGGQISKLSTKSFYSQKSKDGPPKKVFKDKSAYCLYRNAMEQCEKIRKHSPTPGNSVNWNVKLATPEFIEQERKTSRKTYKQKAEQKMEQETARPVEPKIITEKYVIQKKVKKGFPATTVKIGNKSKIVYPTKKLQYTLNQQSKTMKETTLEAVEKCKRERKSKARYTIENHHHTVEFIPQKVEASEQELNSAVFYKKYYGKGGGNSGESGSEASRGGHSGNARTVTDDGGHTVAGFADPKIGAPSSVDKEERPWVYGEHGSTGEKRAIPNKPHSTSQMTLSKEELLLIQKHPKMGKATKYGKMDINKKYNILLKMNQHKKKLAYHVVKPSEKKDTLNEEEKQLDDVAEKPANETEDLADSTPDPILSHPALTQSEPKLDMDPLKYRRTVIVNKEKSYDIDDICLKSNEKSAHQICANHMTETKPRQPIMLKENQKMYEIPKDPAEEDPPKRAVTPAKIKELIDNQRFIKKHDIAAQNLKDYVTKLQQLREQTSIDRATRFSAKASNLAQEATPQKLEKVESIEPVKKVVRILQPGDLFTKKILPKDPSKAEDTASVASKGSVGIWQSGRNPDDIEEQLIQSISAKVSENIAKKLKLAEEERKDQISQFGKLMEHSKRELKKIRVKSGKTRVKTHATKTIKARKSPRYLLDDYKPSEKTDDIKKANFMKKLLDSYAVKVDTRKTAERSEMMSKLKIKEILSKKDIQEKKKKVFLTDMKLVPTKIGDGNKFQGNKSKTRHQENDEPSKAENKSCLVSEVVVEQQEKASADQLSNRPSFKSTEDNVTKRSFLLSDYSKPMDKKDDAMEPATGLPRNKEQSVLRKSYQMSDTVIESKGKEDQVRLKSKSFVPSQRKRDMLAFKSLTALKEQVKQTEKHLIVKAETSTQGRAQKKYARENAEAKKQVPADRPETHRETGDSVRQHRYLLSEDTQDQPENIDSVANSEEYTKEDQTSSATRNKTIHNYLLENYIPKSKDVGESNDSDTLTKTVILEHPTYKCLLDNSYIDIATKGEIGGLTSEGEPKNVRQNKLEISYPKVTNEMNSSNKEYTCLLSVERHGTDQNTTKGTEPKGSTATTKNKIEEYDQIEHDVENQHRRNLDRRNMYVPYTKNLSSEHFAGLHKNSAPPDESVPSHEAHENQNATRTNEDLMDQNVQSFYEKRISKSSEGEDYGHEEKQARAQLQLVEQHQKRDVSAAETVERENASTRNESSRLQKPPANFSMNIRHPQIPRDPPPPPPKNDSNKKEKPKGKSDLILPPPKGQPSNTKLAEVMKERYIHKKEKESVKGKKVNVKIKALKFKFTKPIARKVSPTGNEVFFKQINEGKKATESKHAKNRDSTSVRKVEEEEVIEGPFLCRNVIERNVVALKKSKTETPVRQEKYRVKAYTAPEQPAHRSQMKSSYTVEDDKMFRCTSYDKNMEIIKKNEDKRRRILGRRQVLEKEQPRVKETIPEVGIKQHEQVKNKPGKAFEKDFDISEDKPRINIGDSKKEIKNNKVSNRIDIDIVKETIPEVGIKQHEEAKYKPGKVLEKDFDISEDKPRINIGDSKKEIKNTKVSNRIDIDIVKEAIPEVGIKQHEQVKNKPGKVLEKDFDISEDKPRIDIGDSKREIKNTEVNNRIDIDVGEKIDKIRPEMSGVMNKLPEIDYDKTGRTIKKKPPTIRSKTGKTIEKALLTSHLEQNPVSNDNIEGANITVDEEISLSRGHTEDSTETIKKNEELRRRIFGKRKVFKEEQEQLEEESEIVNKNKPEYGHPRQLEVGIAKQPPETDNDKSKNVTNKRDHTKKEAQSPTFSKKDKSPTKSRLEENLDEELNTKNLKSSYTVDDDIIFLSSSYQGDNIEMIKKNQELRRRIFGRRKVFKEEQEELDEQSELGSKPSENTKDPPVFEKDPDPLTEPHRINIEKLRNEIQDISQKRKKANAEKSERLVQQEISEQADPSKLPEVDVSKKVPEIKYEETKGTKETKDISKKETKSPTMKSKESGRKGEPLAEESKTLLASNHDQKNIETIQNNEELRRTIFGKRKVFKGEQDQLEEESELVGKPSEKATYELIKVYEKDLEKRRINIENLKEEIKNINENRKNEESLTKFEKLRQKVISGQPAKLSKVDVNKTVPEMAYEKNRCMKEKVGWQKETLSTTKVSTPTARTDKSLTEAQVLADLIESIIIKKIKILDTVDNDKVQLSSSHRETNKKDKELKPTVGSKGKGFKEDQDKVEKELSEKNKVVPTEDFRRELDDSKETRIMNIESLRQEIEDKDINRQTAVAVEKFEKLRQKMIGNNEDHSRLLKDDDNKSVPNDCEQSANAFEDNMTLAKQEAPENKVLADKSKRSEFAKSWSSRDVKMINAENLRNEIAQKQYIREANGKHKEISATYVNNRVSKASSGVKHVVGDRNKKDSLKSGKEKIHLSKTVVKDVKPRSFSALVKCRTGFRTPDMRIEDQNKHKNESFMEKGVIREARNHLADPSLYQKKEISPKSQRKEVKPRSYSVPIQKASEELTNERQYKYILDDAHVPEKAKKKADKLNAKDKKENELVGPPLEIGVIRETRNHIGNMLETALPKPNQKEKVISMDLGVIRESRNNIGDIDKTDLSKPQKVKVTSSKTGRQEAKPRSYSAPVQKRSEVRNTDMNTKKQYKYMLDDVPEKASKKADKLDAKDKKKQELSGLSLEIQVLKEAIKNVDDVDKRAQSKLQEKKATSSNSARTEVKSRSSSAPVQKTTEAKSRDIKSNGQNKLLLDYKPDKGTNIDELDTNEKKSRKSSILLKEDTKPAASVPKLDKNLINVEKTSSKIDQKEKTSRRATSPPHAALKKPHTATSPFRPPSPTKHSTPKSSDNEPKASKTATIQLERTKQPDKLTPADSKYLSDRAKRNRRSSSLQSQPKKDDAWRSQSPMPRARSEVSYYDQYKKRVQSLSPAPRAKKVEGTSSEKDKSQETKAYDNILEEKECDDCFSSKGKPAKDAKSETKEGTKKASGGGKGSAGKPSKKKSNLVLNLILPKIETNKEDAPIKLTSTPSVPTKGGTEKKKADSSVPSKALSSAFVLQEKPSATSVTPTKKMSCRLDDFVCADSFVKAKEEAKEPENFKDPQAEFKQLLDDPYSKILSSKYLLRPTQQYAKSCRLDEFESGLSDFLAPQPQQGLTEVLTTETESKKSDTKIQHSNKQDITMMHSEEFKGTIVDQKQQEPKPQAPLKVTATLPKPKQDITMMDTEEFKGIFVDQKHQESKPQALLKATATLPKPKPQEEDSSKEKQAPEKLKPEDIDIKKMCLRLSTKCPTEYRNVSEKTTRIPPIIVSTKTATTTSMCINESIGRQSN